MSAQPDEGAKTEGETTEEYISRRAVEIADAAPDPTPERLVRLQRIFRDAERNRAAEQARGESA